MSSGRSFGLGDEIGSLTPGKLTDVIVVDGNPLPSMRDLRNVVAVVRDGRVCKRPGAESTVVYSLGGPKPVPRRGRSRLPCYDEFVTPEAFSLVTTGLGSVITLLLGLLVWFLRREIKQNDEAHKNLGQRIDRVEGKIDGLRGDIGALREDIGVLTGILNPVIRQS